MGGAAQVPLAAGRVGPGVVPAPGYGEVPTALFTAWVANRTHRWAEARGALSRRGLLGSRS
jgi:hypothetical protein